MMAKGEVASIVLYCSERKVSFKSRLEELGIAQWRFYKAKGRYEKSKNECSSNELLELGNKGWTSKLFLQVKLGSPNKR